MKRETALKKIKEKAFDVDILEEIKKRTKTSDEEWEEIMRAKPATLQSTKLIKRFLKKKESFLIFIKRVCYKKFYEKFRL